MPLKLLFEKPTSMDGMWRHISQHAAAVQWTLALYYPAASITPRRHAALTTQNVFCRPRRKPSK
jgi:hypothetical protein